MADYRLRLFSFRVVRKGRKIKEVFVSAPKRRKKEFLFMNRESIKKKRAGFAGIFLVFTLSSCGTNGSPKSSIPSDSSIALSSASSSSILWSSTSSFDAGLSVKKPTNALSSSFVYGIDCSMAGQVEELGGHYYGESGQEEDLFSLLKKEGSTACRFRLWVDPESSSKVSYGGGGNSLARDLALAKRAQEAGLKILLDFHYSDFWTDPSHYLVPKAWAALSESAKVSALKSYTQDSLQSFKNAGITVDWAQIGNEINPGIAGVAPSSSAFYDLLKAGSSAAKAVFPHLETVIHLTNVNNASSTIDFFKTIQSHGVDFDVAGVSYYPYWHGSKENLQTVLNSVANETGQKVMILETAWGFTDEKTAYAHNQYSSSGFGKIGGYATSPQGQADELCDLFDVLSKVPNQKGAGLFYWEPDWLPVKGADWASPEGQYYNEHGIDGVSTESEDTRLQSWANQAWFSYEGKLLPSASVYRRIRALEESNN